MYFENFSKFSPDASILLDCGEGSIGQLYRFYGDRTEDIIRSIKALHITHMHGDHHMGIMDLVRLRQKCIPENRSPLLLMAPMRPFEELLSFYEQNFGNVRNEFDLMDNADLVRLKFRFAVFHLILIWFGKRDE